MEAKYEDIRISLGANFPALPASQHEQIIPDTGDWHRGHCGKGLTIIRVFGVSSTDLD